MFQAIRTAIITFFTAITNLSQALANVSKAAEVASEVTIIQANSWKEEQQQELNKLKAQQ